MTCSMKGASRNWYAPERSTSAASGIHAVPATPSTPRTSSRIGSKSRKRSRESLVLRMGGMFGIGGGKLGGGGELGG